MKSHERDFCLQFDDDITPCLTPSTERPLDRDDDHEAEVCKDSQTAEASQQDSGYSLLLVY